MVNGGGGTDTLNLTVAGVSSLPTDAGITGVEVINFNLASGASLPALDTSIFTGVQQLWPSDNDGTDSFAAVTVDTGVTAGFRSTGTAATVTAAAGVTDVAVALDGVLSGSNITLAGDLTSVSVSGSVAATAGSPAIPGIDLDFGGDFTGPGDTPPAPRGSAQHSHADCNCYGCRGFVRIAVFGYHGDPQQFPRSRHL